MRERTAHGSSIREALKDAADRLAASGLPSSRREASMLWAAVAGAGTKPGDVWLQRDREPAPELLEPFWQAVEQRSSGVHAGCGMRGVVADVGTGCGCIALALAVEGTFERVIAVEGSAAAAALARENVALVQPPVPVEVRDGDLLAPLAGGRYRAIVSNPPYLTEAEHAALDPAVRLFEPREALVSGADGLTATRALLAGARTLLEPGGFVALELDERRADQVRALALRHGWSGAAVYDDLFGRPRFLLAGLDEEGGA